MEKTFFFLFLIAFAFFFVTCKIETDWSTTNYKDAELNWKQERTNLICSNEIAGMEMLVYAYRIEMLIYACKNEIAESKC